MRKHKAWQVIVALLLAGSAWFYFDRILVPYQLRDAAANQRPRGNLSDLYPRWIGARELLLHGRNPYSAEVSREAQLGYYGRALDPLRPNDPKDEQGFAYPVYVVFFLAPTIFLPFGMVRGIYVAALWMTSAASVWLWMKALRWRRPPATLIAVVVLAMGSFPFIQGIKLQQLTLLVAGMLAASIAALIAGYFMLAGFLLALCTIKPQLVWLIALWLIAWSLTNWRQRQRFGWTFAITMTALLLGAQIVLPGWVGDFWQALHNYHQYTHNQSILSWLFTPLWGNLAAVLLVGMTVWLCRTSLRANVDSEGFALSLALVTCLTIAIIPTTALYNQFLLLPVLLLIIRDSSPRGGAYKTLRFGTLALVCLPWLASFVLMLGSFVLSASRVQSLWKVPFAATFSLPLFAFATLAWRAALDSKKAEN